MVKVLGLRLRLICKSHSSSHWPRVWRALIAAIENGYPPEFAAQKIWEAVDADSRELLIAEGMEAAIVDLRAKEPDKLFDMMEAMVAQGYAQKMAAENN